MRLLTWFSSRFCLRIQHKSLKKFACGARRGVRLLTSDSENLNWGGCAYWRGASTIVSLSRLLQAWRWCRHACAPPIRSRHACARHTCEFVTPVSSPPRLCPGLSAFFFYFSKFCMFLTKYLKNLQNFRKIWVSYTAFSSRFLYSVFTASPIPRFHCVFNSVLRNFVCFSKTYKKIVKKTLARR